MFYDVEAPRLSDFQVLSRQKCEKRRCEPSPTAGPTPHGSTLPSGGLFGKSWIPSSFLGLVPCALVCEDTNQKVVKRRLITSVYLFVSFFSDYGQRLSPEPQTYKRVFFSDFHLHA